MANLPLFATKDMDSGSTLPGFSSLLHTYVVCTDVTDLVFPEADAEIEFGVQDIDYRSTSVKGRERREWKRKKSNRPDEVLIKVAGGLQLVYPVRAVSCQA